MDATTQTVVALALVALAATWWLLRIFAKKSKGPGCGGSCACPSHLTKTKLTKKP
jgi:hypothetical protein